MSQQLPVTHQYQSISPRYGHYELQQAFVYQCYLSAVYDSYESYTLSKEIKEFVYMLWDKEIFEICKYMYKKKQQQHLIR